MLDCLCQPKARTGRQYGAGRRRSLRASGAFVTFVSVVAHIPSVTDAAREETLTNSSHDVAESHEDPSKSDSRTNSSIRRHALHTATPPPWEDMSEKLGSGLPKMVVMAFVVTMLVCCGVGTFLARRAVAYTNVRVPAFIDVNQPSLGGSLPNVGRRGPRSARTRNDREYFLNELTSHSREDHCDGDEYSAFISDSEDARGP
mmetsp:Transcript_114772/g.180735  ORF Transcript_114772/g.180735 Transcript_114772/m.180735 type:complete len:202 (+) Transcript_114772:19-624(+)